jgi:probable addiction module antidote protein
METVDYREGLLERLKDHEFAAAYLDEVLSLNDDKALLVALKDVVDAHGGVGELARKASLNRQSLYKSLSEKGNPTLGTLRDILRQLGLRLSIAPTS